MGLVGARRNNEWAGRRDLTVNLSPRFNWRSSLNWNCGSDEEHVDDGAQGNNKKETRFRPPTLTSFAFAQKT